LVERQLCKLEVRSSNLLASTNFCGSSIISATIFVADGLGVITVLLVIIL
jgi:hypothetical protein